MPQKVLADDWSDYDLRKKGYANVTYIDCTVEWEAEYLTLKILKAYPLYSFEEVKSAVASCCRNLPVPYKRVSFVTCLMIMLKEGVPQSTVRNS